MWPFNRRRDEKKDWELDAPGLAMLELFSGGVMPTSSGTTVGPESAMRVPAAGCAIRAIAETLASLPLRVYRRGSGNSRDLDLDHLANAVLEMPAPWSSGYELRLGLAYDAIKYGQAFAFALRGGGKVKELHRVLYGAMRYEINPATQEPRYVLTSAGGRVFSWQDVVHLVPIPPSQTGAMPMSLVMAAAEPIGLASAMARHGGSLFRNGARPGGVISMPGKIDPSAYDRLRASIRNRFSGQGVGDTLILENAAKWEALAMTSVDAQFNEVWTTQVLEIARVFRVPPSMLAELERTTHTNAEELALQFVSYCIRPWAQLFESGFSRVLFTSTERRQLFLEHDFSDLEKGDLAGRLEALGKAVANGVYAPNDARARENLGPLPGGDDLRVPLNSVVPGTPRDMGNPDGNAPPEPQDASANLPPAFGQKPRVVA